MKISRSVVEGYLNCKYKGHLLLNGSEGTLHDYERAMAELQETHSAKAKDRLIHKRLKPPFPSSGDLANLDLRSGSQVIFSPVVEDEEVAFRLDAVCRVEDRSSLGKFHYIPVLFHQGETMGRLQRTLLAVSGLILGRSQQIVPQTGLAICGPECATRTIKLSPLNRMAQKVLDEVGAMIGGKTVPRLILQDHCQQCQFRPGCLDQAFKADDLSLLGRITEKQLAKYAEKGITTVTQLSYTYRARRGKNAHPKQNPRSLPLQALAIRQQRILVVGKPSFPASNVRIYFDAEGDPERKLTYLLGLLIVKGGQEEMISLWADDPLQEKALFRQFFDVLARYNNYTLFHYGQYEAALLRQMGTMVRPKKLVDAAIAVSVNMLAPLHSGVYFPTYSNGLKDIGRYLGFSWSEANVLNRLGNRRTAGVDRRGIGRERGHVLGDRRRHVQKRLVLLYLVGREAVSLLGHPIAQEPEKLVILDTFAKHLPADAGHRRLEHRPGARFAGHGGRLGRVDEPAVAVAPVALRPVGRAVAADVAHRVFVGVLRLSGIGGLRSPVVRCPDQRTHHSPLPRLPVPHPKFGSRMVDELRTEGL